MNGQGMQLKPSYDSLCEATPKIQSMIQETNDILRLSKDVKMLIGQIRTSLFGLYPDEANNKNQEPSSINEYVEASKYVLIDALEELYRLKERL